MQVSNPNNVKIYNLSAGKSLPEWLSDRKKRLLQKKDIDIRKRIQLIQDFEMPGVSNQVQVSKDGQFILVTGIYKPRVRCYDVNQLSMKFERCFDAEVVKFLMLSEDYSKMVFLHTDRCIEFHASYGKYFKIRIPKFGRDMAYHQPSCDLYFVGASSEVYRLNLEQGRFLNSFQTEAHSVNVCTVNPVHQLFVCGTEEGRVEAWDPRVKERVGILDCALSSITPDSDVKGIPSITSLSFNQGLTMAVGTATGQILIYDVRSDKPLLVKDHLYGLPILKTEFHPSQNLIVSMDPKIVKLWDKNTGKPFTSIQATSDLNDLSLVPNTGMMFLANEDRKVLTYYIPTLGPAPKWCAFLDSLTEELEETNLNTVYDDYRFVTKKELDDLGLNHLIGSNLLRAYMHGYFIDVRLYNKAKAIVDPFAYADYRKRKVKERVEAERQNRVQIKKLPRVNKELAQKIMDQLEEEKTKKKKLPNLMEDDRFKAMFENPEFQVDQNNDEYRLLHPLVSKADKAAIKKVQTLTEQHEYIQQFKEVEGEDSNSEDEADDSSDDDQSWAQQLRQQHKILRREDDIRRRQEDAETEVEPRFYEIKDGEIYVGPRGKVKRNHSAKESLGERLQRVEIEDTVIQHTIGGRSLSFKLNKKSKTNQKREETNKKHLEERKKIRRSTKSIETKNRFIRKKI